VRNALTYLLEDSETLIADAPAGLDVSLLKSESAPGTMFLSLVNTISKPYRPLGALADIGRAAVKIRLTDGSSAFDVSSKTGNKISAMVEKNRTGSWLNIVVQNIGEFAGVYIEPKN
jgi:hypothetical protein